MRAPDYFEKVVNLSSSVADSMLELRDVAKQAQRERDECPQRSVVLKMRVETEFVRRLHELQCKLPEM